MLNDIRKSLSLVWHDRLTSPLSGAITLSWLTVNWKIPYTLFLTDHSITLQQRLELVSPYFRGWYLLRVFPVPIAIAVFLIWVYPYFTTFALKETLKHKKVQRDARNEIDMATLLTLEESMILTSENRELKEKHSKDLSDQDKEIKNHVSINENLTKLNQDHEKKIRSLTEAAAADKIKLQVELKKSASQSNEIIRFFRHLYGYPPYVVLVGFPDDLRS